MKKTLVFAAAVFLLAVLFAPTAGAQNYNSYDYYIKDFFVDVVANSDRSYDVTETITVVFNEESHGIFRDIQTVSSVEQYHIANINVAGDPFTVSERSDYINVRIGDPDVYITGEKTYTISYTRVHYDDGEPDYDYFYMDLIGDKWDVPIANFSAMVRLPEAAGINRVTLTSGPTGSVSNDYAQYSESGNVVKVRMTNPLGPFMAVTLNVEMMQGAFPDAVPYSKPLVIHSVFVSAELDRYGVMDVREEYDATVSRGFRVWHPAYAVDGLEGMMWTFEDNEQAVYAGSSHEVFGRYAGERIRFTVTYRVRCEITETESSHLFTIRLFSDSDEISVESYSLCVVSPNEITSGYMDAYFNRLAPDEYFLSISDYGRRLDIEADGGEGMRYVSVDFLSSGYIRPMNWGDVMIPFAAVIAAVLIFLNAFVINPGKRIVETIELGPPDGMNPAEIGYVIDGKISGRDVTSLIYYWASHGHISIEIADRKNNFTLHKREDLDSGHKPYENYMFTRLFGFGSNDAVTNSDIKYNFHPTISKTVGEVRRSFTGDRELKRRVRLPIFIAFLMIILCALMFSAFSQLWVYTSYDMSDNAFIASILYMIMAIIASTYRKNMHKKPRSNYILIAVLIALYVLFSAYIISSVAGRAITVVSTIVTLAALAVTLYSTPFLSRQTDFAVYLLGRIIGFKTFLTTAEKSRLEMLLAENPDYYFNILPYAQCLGVSAIWERKFDGLLRQPPSWCYGDGVDDVAPAVIMSGITRSLSHSLNAVEASTDSGGGSSGGGGGYSGGGSSGGGGGGGGGRW